MVGLKFSSLSEFPLPPAGKKGWPWTEGAPRLPNTMPDGGSWPRISIVTPSFNQGHFLEETIRSVLLQGYPNLEYLVIDGGSTDQSLDIIKKYEPWLTGWISEKDRGQSHAINKGFKLCTGDLITFQNSDDYYYAGALPTAARLWGHHSNCGAIVGGFRRCDAASKSIGEHVRSTLTLPTPRDLTLGPPGAYRLHQVSTFYTKIALDAVGRQVAEDLKYVMDRELLYRVCRQFEVVLSNDCFAAFRSHADSKSVSLILPFAREFSKLYCMALNGNPTEDLQRRRMARYRLTAGYLKAGRQTPHFYKAAFYLIRAAWSDASILKKHQYARAWCNRLMPRLVLSRR